MRPVSEAPVINPLGGVGLPSITWPAESGLDLFVAGCNDGAADERLS